MFHIQWKHKKRIALFIRSHFNKCISSNVMYTQIITYTQRLIYFYFFILCRNLKLINLTYFCMKFALFFCLIHQSLIIKWRWKTGGGERELCVCVRYNYICIAQTHLFYVSHKFVWGCANKLSAYIFLLGLRNVHNLCNSIFIRFSFFFRFFFCLIKMRERQKHLHLFFSR